MRPNDIILQADDKQWLHLLRQLFDGFSIDMFSSKRGGCFFFSSHKKAYMDMMYHCK